MKHKPSKMKSITPKITPEENYTKFNVKEFYEDMKFEVDYKWNNILDFFYNIKHGIKNFWYFRKVIWNYRFWDYNFFLDVQRKMLEEMERNWCKNTHYVGDEKEKEDLQELLKLLDKIDECEENIKDCTELYKEFGEKLYGEVDSPIYGPDEKIKGHKKISSITRFWD